MAARDSIGTFLHQPPYLTDSATRYGHDNFPIRDNLALVEARFELRVAARFRRRCGR